MVFIRKYIFQFVDKFRIETRIGPDRAVYCIKEPLELGSNFVTKIAAFGLVEIRARWLLERWIFLFFFQETETVSSLN